MTAVGNDDHVMIDKFFLNLRLKWRKIEGYDQLKILTVLEAALSKPEGKAMESILRYLEDCYHLKLSEKIFEHVNEIQRHRDKESFANLFHAICFHGQYERFQRKLMMHLSPEIIGNGLRIAVGRGHLHLVKNVLQLIGGIKISYDDRVQIILRNCPAQQKGMIQAAMIHIDKCSVQVQQEMFDFVCRHNMPEFIVELNKLSFNLTLLRRGIHLIQPDNWRIKHVLLEVMNGVVGCVGNCMNSESVLLYKLFQDIAVHTGIRVFKLRSCIKNHFLDLICDRRLCHVPRQCTRKVSQADREESGKAAYHAMISCQGCSKFLYNYEYTTFHQIMQLRLLLQRDKYFDITTAIEENNVLLAERLLKETFYLFHVKKSLRVGPSLKSNEQMYHLIKSAIEKKFKANYKGYCHYVFLAKHQGELHIFSVHHGQKQQNEDKFLGLPVFWKSIKDISVNRPSSPKLEPDSQQNIKVSNESAELLFKTHSNLNIITTTSFSLRGNELVRAPCIALYCWAKDYIPIHVSLFPRQIGGIPTDVREGFCVFGGTSLPVGETIGTVEDPSRVGTIGGFVVDKNNQTFGVTCAHVLYPVNSLTERISVQRTVRTADGHIIGKTVIVCFRQGNANETSVDAALFRIGGDDRDESFEIDGHFPKIDVKNLRTVGYDGTSYPVFSSGDIIDIYETDNDGRGYRNPVIKYGSTTKLTKGSLACEGCHVRIQNLSLEIKELISAITDQTARTLNYDEQMDTDDLHVKQSSKQMYQFVMYGQAEIEEHTLSKPFFDLGDSGSFVFYEDNDGRLKCIGMAIGCTSYGTCIMTPIKDVLEALGKCAGLPSEGEKLFLKKFDNSVSSSTAFLEENPVVELNNNTSSPSGQSASVSKQAPNDIANLLKMFGKSITASFERTLDQKLELLNASINRMHATFGSFEQFQGEMDTRLRFLERKHRGKETSTVETVEDSDDDL